MAFKKWVIGNSDKALAKHLAEECDIDPFIAMLAAARGYSDETELEQFLSDEVMLCDPRELIDIEKAAEIVNEAISTGTKIAVFGDYDCDGVTASAIMYDYLVSRGSDVIVYIPERVTEGYGMNKEAIAQLHSQGIGLIITVDNGIACNEEIEYAASLGIKTVVTDHHLPTDTLPNAAAVVDPHRRGCPSSFKEICGAEVAFKLICVMDDKEPDQLLPRYADLLAIATIGDIMPLTHENRSIVKEGIKQIKNNCRTGISALINVAGLDRAKINSGNVSFGIVPRINAAGRMDSAMKAFRLLTTTSIKEALDLANELDSLNSSRQQIERKILSEACEKIEAQSLQYNRVIVVCGEDWHPGVVGIVASRIVEKYGKVAIVLTREGELAFGSGRSIAPFSLYDALNGCSSLLEKFGGHALAAGLTIEVGNIDAFRKAINEYAVTLEAAAPTLNIDLKLNPAGLSIDMADSIGALEPFGLGNPSPVFALMGVTLSKITPIGDSKHLRLLFTKNEAVFQALLFGVRPEQFCFEIGDVLDLAVSLSTNEYNSNITLSIQIKALRMSGIDYDAFMDNMTAYHDYLGGYSTDCAAFAPTREEVGEIYKLILNAPIKNERLKYIAGAAIGFAKTQAAVAVLEELGLITHQNGRLSAVRNAARTNLEQSQIYQKLHGRESQ